MTESDWPVADFDAVRSLRVLAAASPGASLVETVIEASIESVWAVAADIEQELPRWLFPDIRSVQLTPTAEPERLVALAKGYSGLRARFDVVLRPGWCLMQSRFLSGGMAATSEGRATRFALLGGFKGPLRVLNPIGRTIAAHALNRFAQRVHERGPR